MAYELAHLDLTFEAGSDLTSGRFKVVALASDGQVDLSETAGEASIGVLQDDALSSAAGTAVTVRVAGVSKVYAGGTVAAGDAVAVHTTDGTVETAGSGDYPIGIALDGNDAGELISVLIIPTLTPRA